MDNTKLYWKYVGMNIKSQLEYKASFILNFINQFILFFTYYFTVISLFTRFKVLEEYTMYEVLLIFSIFQIAFSINEVFARGIDDFHKLIIKGGLDRLLTRPRPIILQALGFDFALAKLAKLLQAIILFIIAIIKLNIVFTIDKVLCILFMIIGATVLFFSIFLIGAAFTFITIQGLEFINVFTYGGREMSQYPINIYHKFFRIFFTYVLPFGLINYYPLLYIIGKNNNPLFVVLPLIPIIHLIIAIYIFNKALEKYTSTGS